MRNNKGYSLVELLISVAIFSLVMCGIISIMNTTSVFYRGGQQEVRLQEEAQIALNQIEELLIDVDDNVVTVNNSIGGREYKILKKDGVSYGLKQDGERLMYKQIGATGDSGWVLMAEGVTEFEISGFEYNGGPNRDVGDNRVSVNVGVKSGKYEYTAKKDVYFRNAIENDTMHTTPQSTSDSQSTNNQEYDFEYNIRRGEKLNLFSEFGIVSGAMFVSGSSMQPSQHFDMYANTNTSTGITEYIVTVKGTMLSSFSHSISKLSAISVTGKDSKDEDVKVLLLLDPVDFEIEVPAFQFTVDSPTNAGSPKWIEFEGIDFRGYSNLKYDMVLFSDNNGDGLFQTSEQVGMKAEGVSFGSPTNLYSGPNGEKVNVGVRVCQNTGFAVVFQHNDKLNQAGANMLTSKKHYLKVNIYNGSTKINTEDIYLRALPHGAANGFE